MNSFKRGDIVKLMSGGPDMTIHQKHDPVAENLKWVECRWFVKGKLRTDVFREETLIRSSKRIVPGNPNRNQIEADTEQG